MLFVISNRKSEASVEKAVRGRPPKKPEDRAGGVIHFRVRGDYRAALENAALLSGRSLSEECEFRLGRSIQREAALAEMFGSPDHQDFLLAVGNAARLASAMSDGGEDATIQVRAAVISLVERFAGKKARAVLDEAASSGHSGELAAERVVSLQSGKLQPKKALTEIIGR